MSRPRRLVWQRPTLDFGKTAKRNTPKRLRRISGLEGTRIIGPGGCCWPDAAPDASGWPGLAQEARDWMYDRPAAGEREANPGLLEIQPEEVAMAGESRVNWCPLSGVAALTIVGTMALTASAGKLNAQAREGSPGPLAQSCGVPPAPASARGGPGVQRRFFRLGNILSSFRRRRCSARATTCPIRTAPG